MAEHAVAFEQIAEAADRIKGKAHETPVCGLRPVLRSSQGI